MNNNQTNPEPADPGILHHIYASVAATLTLTVILCGVYPLVVWGIGQALFADKANGSLIKDAGGKIVGSALLGQPFGADKYFHPRPSSAGSGYDASNSSASNLGPTSAKLLYGTTKPSPPPTASDAAATTAPTSAPAAAATSTPPATQPATTQPSVVVDFDGIRDRVVHYIVENNLAYTSNIPLDGFKDAQGNLDDVKLIMAFSDDKNPLVVTPKDPIPADAVTGSGSGLDPHISVANAAIQVARVAKARGADAEKVKSLIARNTDGPDLGIFGEAGVNVLKLNLALDKELPAK